MILAPHLSIYIFAKSGGAAPTTTVLWAETFMLQRGLVSYEHTIANNFGFESLNLEIVCDLESALTWQDDLGVGVLVFSPDSDVVWEGRLTVVNIQAGQESGNVALDSVGNRVKGRYTTYLGTPGVTAAVQDTDSQSAYGIRDLVFSAGTTTSAAATNAATAKLADVAFPRMVPSSEAATGGGIGDTRLTLTFEGWYGATDDVVTSDTSTTTTTTTTQVGTLLSDLAAINPLISTSTSHIVSSGVSDTEFIADDTTYREKIETLLAQGSSSGVRLVWGVYETRVFYVEGWAGAVPSNLDYQRNAGEAIVRSKSGGIIPWWDVRPNKMYQRTDFLDVAPSSAQADTAGRFAVERVTCRIAGDTVSLTLEGAGSSGADAMIARLSN